MCAYKYRIDGYLGFVNCSYDLVNNMIQYDVSIDYGMDVERKLYYYFRWVDTELRIPILDNPPPGGIL